CPSYTITFFHYLPLIVLIIDPATTNSHLLSLHDALPIWSRPELRAQSLERLVRVAARARRDASVVRQPERRRVAHEDTVSPEQRSEEHTSELQSLTNLVCRLLLEKKKQQ